MRLKIASRPHYQLYGEFVISALLKWVDGGISLWPTLGLYHPPSLGIFLTLLEFPHPVFCCSVTSCSPRYPAPPSRTLSLPLSHSESPLGHCLCYSPPPPTLRFLDTLPPVVRLWITCTWLRCFHSVPTLSHIYPFVMTFRLNYSGRGKGEGTLVSSSSVELSFESTSRVFQSIFNFWDFWNVMYVLHLHGVRLVFKICPLPIYLYA